MSHTYIHSDIHTHTHMHIHSHAHIYTYTHTQAAREKSKGLDYRYTDNINFWLASLQKLGLPKVSGQTVSHMSDQSILTHIV